MTVAELAIATTVEADEVTVDLTAHRTDVVRRLIERGVPPHTLGTILPGWEPFLDAAVAELGTGG